MYTLIPSFQGEWAFWMSCSPHRRDWFLPPSCAIMNDDYALGPPLVLEFAYKNRIFTVFLIFIFTHVKVFAAAKYNLIGFIMGVD